MVQSFSFLQKKYNLGFFGILELFDIITIIFSIILIIISFIDLLFTYNQINKSKEWDYFVGSFTFFLPMFIAILQWKFERNRDCQIYPE